VLRSRLAEAFFGVPLQYHSRPFSSRNPARTCAACHPGFLFRFLQWAAAFGPNPFGRDTATVELASRGDPFVFVDDAGQRRPTHAFDGAEVIGKHGRKAVIKQSKGAPSAASLSGFKASMRRSFTINPRSRDREGKASTTRSVSPLRSAIVVIISTVMLPVVWAGLMAQRCFQLNESSSLRVGNCWRRLRSARLPTIRVTEIPCTSTCNPGHPARSAPVARLLPLP